MLLDEMTSLTVSTLIATTSLLISGLTAWLTLFRRGTVRMTRPTLFFFGPDGRIGGPPKVTLRTLLFSTAQRGQIVESMFVRVVRGESVQNFNIWVYGDDRMSRGSGIYVGHDGLAAYHHFLLPRDGTAYEFLPGEYTVQVFATLLGRRAPLLLARENLTLPTEVATGMKNSKLGCFFDWGPDSQRYHAHVDSPRVPNDLGPEQVLAELAELAEAVSDAKHSDRAPKK